MSLAAIRAEAMRVTESAHLEAHARADVLCALERNANDTSPFLLALGLEAKVRPALALARAVGVYFHIAALQLADDLADGDCDYLTPPVAAGTIAQFMLQNLGYLVLLGADLPTSVLRDTALDLAVGSSAQSLEVRTKRWTLEATRITAESFGAIHYAAYFRLMLHGCAFERDARMWGRGLGIGAAISSDFTSNDPRVMTLPPTSRAELLSWALTATSAASRTPLRCLASALDRIEVQLMRELALLVQDDARGGSVPTPLVARAP